MAIIRDGSGNGYAAAVSPKNRLKTESVISTTEHHVNHHDKEAYAMSFETAPDAADDCILYMVNNSALYDIVIEGYEAYVSQACTLYCKLGAKGTRNNATSSSPVNLHAGSGHVADGTFEYGIDLDGGSATLTGGSIACKSRFIAETATKYYNFEQDIVVPKNQTFTLWCDTAGTQVTGTMLFNFHDKDGVG